MAQRAESGVQCCRVRHAAAATLPDVIPLAVRSAGLLPGQRLHCTAPPFSAIDRAQYLQREDLLGETLRLADRMAQSSDTLHDVAAPALKQIYDHVQLRHILNQPDDERMRALLEEAERLCTDLLEAR